MSGNSERPTEYSYTGKATPAQARKIGAWSGPAGGIMQPMETFQSGSLMPFDTELSFRRRLIGVALLPSRPWSFRFAVYFTRLSVKHSRHTDACQNDSADRACYANQVDRHKLTFQLPWRTLQIFDTQCANADLP
jgi:hypothetical protein